MHRKNLLYELETYFASPILTPEELPMYDRIIEFIQSNPDCFERSNPGHITGSALILNHDLSKTLLTHHKKLNIWLQLGGHCDGNENTQEVALQEAQEESGIENLIPLYDGIFDIDIHPIPGNCRMHYDIRYLLIAPANAEYHISNESYDLAWVPLDQIKKYTNERSILRMIEKIKKLKF